MGSIPRVAPAVGSFQKRPGLLCGLEVGCWDIDRGLGGGE